MSRTIAESIDSLIEQCEHLVKRPYVSVPQCQDCHAILHKGMLRDTGNGFYEDGEVLCGFCKADRNHRAEQEIRQCAEPAVPREETVEYNAR